MAQVTLEKVSKIYEGGVRAVNAIDLNIRDREFVVLVGPSGCGKSTTLRMVAGLEDISEGSIRIGDREVNHVPPKDRDIAMVFQNYALYPHMTVYNNMAFGLKLRKLPKSEIDRRVREAARILGIEEYLERRPKALSGGQRQRVAMGRAIVREPAVFLFDEPLSNLDAKMRVEMRKEILHLHRRLNTTMIYVTHDQVEAMTLGDRIVVMNRGLIEQVAEPLTVYNYPASLFVAKFIGTPPMNIFEGTLEQDGQGHAFVSGPIRCPLPSGMSSRVAERAGKKVFLGIRPKAFAPKELASAEEKRIVIKARVDLTETLGDEIIAHLICGVHRFQVSLDPHSRPNLDGDIEVCPVMARAHIFHGDTGVNLTMPQ